MSFKPVFKIFTVKILSVRFLLTHPVEMRRYEDNLWVYSWNTIIWNTNSRFPRI